MPRGVRKRFQFRYKLWFGNGGSIAEESTQDHTEEQFIAVLRRIAKQFTEMADKREVLIEESRDALRQRD